MRGRERVSNQAAALPILNQGDRFPAPGDYDRQSPHHEDQGKEQKMDFSHCCVILTDLWAEEWPTEGMIRLTERGLYRE